MNVLALLLADSRFPGGGHVHSGGLEEAAARGLIRTEEDLPSFLRNRLLTAGALAATFAAAAAVERADWSTLDEELDARTPSAAQRAASRAQGKATARAAKMMAVPPSGSGARAGGTEPAKQRPADGMTESAAGGAMEPCSGDGVPAERQPTGGEAGPPASFSPLHPIPVADSVPPAPNPVAHSVPPVSNSVADSVAPVRNPVADSVPPVPDPVAHSVPPARNPVAALLAAIPRPHHPVILGALVGASGGAPVDAALAAAYLAISGPASASVRLLGLDPLRVNAIVAALAPEVTAVAEGAAAVAHLHPAELPAPGSPGLDLLAEEHDRHHREEVRLFVS